MRKDATAPLEIIRQVHIVAGALIVLGSAASLLTPAWMAVPAFVGAGLFLAGATGFCGMAKLLALMPWNRLDPNVSA